MKKLTLAAFAAAMLLAACEDNSGQPAPGNVVVPDDDCRPARDCINDRR